MTTRPANDLHHDMVFLLGQLSMCGLDQDRGGIQRVAKRNSIPFPSWNFRYHLADHDKDRQR